MKRVVDKEQVESLLPAACDGGFIGDVEERWYCPRCSAAGPWECGDLPSVRAKRLEAARVEDEFLNQN